MKEEERKRRRKGERESKLKIVTKFTAGKEKRFLWYFPSVVPLSCS
jgi:hypothetical protein